MDWEVIEDGRLKKILERNGIANGPVVEKQQEVFKANLDLRGYLS